MLLQYSVFVGHEHIARISLVFTSITPKGTKHKMSGGMLYGGDEIGALVFDLGHHSLRVGYAQEDTPKAEIPAVVGVGEDGNGATKVEPMDIDDKKPDSNITQNGTKYYIDTTILHVPRKNTEVVSYMKDGMIEDWDHFEKVSEGYST